MELFSNDVENGGGASHNHSSVQMGLNFQLNAQIHYE